MQMSTHQVMIAYGDIMAEVIKITIITYGQMKTSLKRHAFITT